MFNRRAFTKSHSDLFRDELAESYGHLKTAAAHAPGGAAEFMTPPYDRTRRMAARRVQQCMAVVIPVYETMKDGAKNARSVAERRVSDDRDRSVLPALLALLAAGVAIGGVAALIMRRRRAAQEWDEFEPNVSDGDGDDAETKVTSATKVTSGAASVAGNVTDRAGQLADSVHSKGNEDKTESERSTPFAAFADDNPTAEDVVRSGNQEKMP